MVNFIIKVPASSANIGCGYDTLGLGLSLWLEVRGTYLDEHPSAESTCRVSVEGLGAHKVSKDPEKNMILRTALNVLLCHGIPNFPRPLHVHINNHIPLGRGLGSSGAAIVAGVVLANVLGHLELSKDRMMEFCLVEESHPDNIGPSLFGGFRGSFTTNIAAKDKAHQAIVDPGDSHHQPDQLPNLSSIKGSLAPQHPTLRAISVSYPWSEEIRIIAVIPDYEVKTENARAALPASYEKDAVVANLQRVAVLPHLLGVSPLRRTDIQEAMQDKLHQNQRCHLVHGLKSLLELDRDALPGSLGICLSGAGPTVLALATSNFDAIAEHIISVIQSATDKEIHCDWQLLDLARDGATVIQESGEDGVARTTDTPANIPEQKQRSSPGYEHYHKRRKFSHTGAQPIVSDLLDGT